MSTIPERASRSLERVTCSYECAVNIADLITLQDVMDAFDLGPNGGLVYCMEYLENNMSWLQEALKPLECAHQCCLLRLRSLSVRAAKYLLFDFPGQVELFTHHQSVRNIVQQLQKWKFQVSSCHSPTALTLAGG